MHQSLCLFAAVKLFYAQLEQQLEFYVHTLQGLAKIITAAFKTKDS